MDNKRSVTVSERVSSLERISAPLKGENVIPEKPTELASSAGAIQSSGSNPNRTEPTAVEKRCNFVRGHSSRASIANLQIMKDISGVRHCSVIGVDKSQFSSEANKNTSASGEVKKDVVAEGDLRSSITEGTVAGQPLEVDVLLRNPVSDLLNQDKTADTNRKTAVVGTTFKYPVDSAGETKKPIGSITTSTTSSDGTTVVDSPGLEYDRIKAIENSRQEMTTSLPAITITDAMNDKLKVDNVAELEASDGEVSPSPTDMDIEAVQDDSKDAVSKTSAETDSYVSDETAGGEVDSRGYEASCSCTSESSGLRNRLLANSDQSAVPQQARENSRSSECLGSKNLHGAIFLGATVTALLGFGLYALSSKGQLPEAFQTIGLATSVLFGITGVFSFFCYSFLDCFPRCPSLPQRQPEPRYEIIRESDSIMYLRRIGNSGGSEEWSAEEERAFRRQNRMTTTLSTEVSLNRNPLSDRTRQLQADITEVVEKFAKSVSEEFLELKRISNSDHSPADDDWRRATT